MHALTFEINTSLIDNTIMKVCEVVDNSWTKSIQFVTVVFYLDFNSVKLYDLFIS